jgi:hypothetical protein
LVALGVVGDEVVAGNFHLQFQDRFALAHGKRLRLGVARVTDSDVLARAGAVPGLDLEGF